MAQSSGIRWEQSSATVKVGETVTVPVVYGEVPTWDVSRDLNNLATAVVNGQSVVFTGIKAGTVTIAKDSLHYLNDFTLTVEANNTQVIVAEQSLQDIADSIRTKLGTSDTYLPSEMSAAIDLISGGGMDLSSIFNGCQQFEVGTFRPSSSATRYTLSHSLGVAPCLILVLDPQSLNSWASDYLYTKVVFGMCYQDPNMTISGGAPSGTGFSLEKHVGHYRNSTSIMTGDYYMQASKGGSDSKFGDGLFSTTERADMCYNSNPSSVVLNFGSYYMMRTIEYNYILGAPNA